MVFNESDIRPQQFNDKMNEAIRKDIEKLSQRKAEFVEVDCPACGMKKHKSIFEKYGFKFSHCRECETVFMNPRATPEILDEFYSTSDNYKFWNENIFPASEEARRVNIVQPRVEKIIEICDKFEIPKNTLVEVGAGYGTFCQEMKDRNYFKEVIAIEPAPDLAATCRNKGIKTVESVIEKVKGQDLCPSVVVSFEVIEHLFSPQEFLSSCGDIMPSGSIMAITCPNYKGFEVSVLGLASETIDAEHINLFNTSSIQILFERSGFEVLECFTPGQLDADIVRNKILEKEYILSANNFLKDILIDRWETLGSKFQDFLRENNLSSHMWAVARKK